MDEKQRKQLKLAWHRHRSQAKFRGEPYHLTLEFWFEFWREQDRYLNRGRASGQFSMTRINPLGSWEPQNVHAETRSLHQQRLRRLSYGQYQGL